MPGSGERIVLPSIVDNAHPMPLEPQAAPKISPAIAGSKIDRSAVRGIIPGDKLGRRFLFAGICSKISLKSPGVPLNPAPRCLQLRGGCGQASLGSCERLPGVARRDLVVATAGSVALEICRVGPLQTPARAHASALRNSPSRPRAPLLTGGPFQPSMRNMRYEYGNCRIVVTRLRDDATNYR